MFNEPTIHAKWPMGLGIQWPATTSTTSQQRHLQRSKESCQNLRRGTQRSSNHAASRTQEKVLSLCGSRHGVQSLRTTQILPRGLIQ